MDYNEKLMWLSIAIILLFTLVAGIGLFLDLRKSPEGEPA